MCFIRRIPHPEEKRNAGATSDNIVFPAIFAMWLEDWDVPPQYRGFWNSLPIRLVLNLTYMGIPYPALTWPDRTEIDPTWCNPGVIAHESAHVSWSLLVDDMKEAFSEAYRVTVTNDKLLHKLFTEKPHMQDEFGKDNNIEGHADCYRYLGQKMPLILRPYYPKLL
jgi:hypothetical protein